MSKKLILEKIILQNVKQLIKERCALLGYVPNEIPKGTFDQNQNYQIKIAGDYTLLRETAIWRELTESSRFKELDITQVELEIILYRFIKEFCAGNEQEMKEIANRISKNKKILTNVDNSISDLASQLLLI
ncbi:hypothetical protein TTHERM_00842430 (macronuclear) [Tetrahymena thermophila SB210]|uniref:Uncharacterized protein n=1 Tax=Tetrahymena thermophila (strain SB210) TaxID=312017 RepID=I7MAZ8_TETTS|nr:hypothetical protein TTHERM_00842430 [Tetrahymena thermophila SB210]EAS07017.2 hypothetical protein TTHERM_00842430 [Tetrahymena thermophila SB210]|eukprot:XP_001027259.2 hypothetical protein TTHERM_00842430 [Tetrahymena thermophila SB210]